MGGVERGSPKAGLRHGWRRAAGSEVKWLVYFWSLLKLPLPDLTGGTMPEGVKGSSVPEVCGGGGGSRAARATPVCEGMCHLGWVCGEQPPLLRTHP